jgi:hypothetical protein
MKPGGRERRAAVLSRLSVQPIVHYPCWKTMRLLEKGRRPPSVRLGELRVVSGVAAAGPILQRNVYGWFDRVSHGTYGLTVAGEQAMSRFAQAIAVLDGLRMRLPTSSDRRWRGTSCGRGCGLPGRWSACPWPT